MGAPWPWPWPWPWPAGAAWRARECDAQPYPNATSVVDAVRPPGERGNERRRGEDAVRRERYRRGMGKAGRGRDAMPRDARATPRRSAPAGVVVPTQPSIDNRGGPLSWRRARGGGIGREPRSSARDARRGFRRRARFPAQRERRERDPSRETSRPRGESPNPFFCTLRVCRKSGATRQSRKSGDRRAMTHLRGARCVRMRPGSSQMYLTPRDARRRWRVSGATRALLPRLNGIRPPGNNPASVCRMRERFDSGRTGIGQSAAAVRGSAAHTLDSDNPPSPFADRPPSRAPPRAPRGAVTRVRRRAT